MRYLPFFFLLLFKSFIANAQSLSVTLPSGSEVYSNDIVKLSWISDTLVDIDYSVDSGANWLNIASGLSPQIQTFEWTVPDIDPGNILLRFASKKSVQVPLTVKNLKLDDTYYTWSKVTDTTPFYERDGAGALVFKDKMWLLGGWDSTRIPVCNSEIWNSTDGVNWELVAVAPWEGRHTAGYVVFKDKMWVVGGDANSGHYQNDVWNTDDGISWVKITDSVPWKDRVLFYTTVFKDKIYVIGGQKMVDASTINFDPLELYNDVWSTADGINWTRELEHGPWHSRGLICGNAVQNGRIWMLGGGTYAQTVPRLYYNDVWSAADGISWTKVNSDSAWQPREYHSIASFDNKLWVIGGWNAENLDDTWYSATGEHWDKVTLSFTGTGHGASVYNFKNSIWLAGGYNQDVWRLIKKATTLKLNQQKDTLLYTGDSLYLRTDRIIGGSYYWEKDNQLLEGLNENYITIKSTGKYRLVFADLEGNSISSSLLSISFINKSNASFMDTTVLWGDTTFNKTLEVDSVDNARYGWFKDGNLIQTTSIPFYSVNSPGAYYAKVRIPQRISLSTDTVHVKYFKPEISSSSNNFVLGEDKMRLTIQAIPGIKYTWYHNGVLILSSNNASIEINDIGTYNVILTTPNGYSYLSDSVKITSGIKNRPTLDIKSVSLANGNLRFEMFNNDYGRVIVELIEMSGRILFREEIVKTGVKLYYTRHISNLPKGLFVVRVTIYNKTSATKAVN